MVNQLNFNEQGKAEIKIGRKVFAKAYNRPVFYAANNIKSGISVKYPFSIELSGYGTRECESVEDCLKHINLYYPSC